MGEAATMTTPKKQLRKAGLGGCILDKEHKPYWEYANYLLSQVEPRISCCTKCQEQEVLRVVDKDEMPHTCEGCQERIRKLRELYSTDATAPDRTLATPIRSSDDESKARVKRPVPDEAELSHSLRDVRQRYNDRQCTQCGVVYPAFITSHHCPAHYGPVYCCHLHAEQLVYSGDVCNICTYNARLRPLQQRQRATVDNIVAEDGWGGNRYISAPRSLFM